MSGPRPHVQGGGSGETYDIGVRRRRQTFLAGVLGENLARNRIIVAVV